MATIQAAQAAISSIPRSIYKNHVFSNTLSYLEKWPKSMILLNTGTNLQF